MSISAFRVYSYTGDVVSVPSGGAVCTLFSCVIPGGTLAQDGAALEIIAIGGASDDAPTKYVRTYIGGKLCNTNLLEQNISQWYASLHLIRKDATGDLIRPKLWADAYYGDGSSSSQNGVIHCGSLVPINVGSFDWTADQTLTMTGQAVGYMADGGITGVGMIVKAWP